MQHRTCFFTSSLHRRWKDTRYWSSHWTRFNLHYHKCHQALRASSKSERRFPFPLKQAYIHLLSCQVGESRLSSTILRTAWCTSTSEFLLPSQKGSSNLGMYHQVWSMENHKQSTYCKKRTSDTCPLLSHRVRSSQSRWQRRAQDLGFTQLLELGTFSFEQWMSLVGRLHNLPSCCQVNLEQSHLFQLRARFSPHGRPISCEAPQSSGWHAQRSLAWSKARNEPASPQAGSELWTH